MNVNMKIFRLINNLANKNLISDAIMIFFSKYGPYIYVAILALIFAIGILKKEEDPRRAFVYRKAFFHTIVFTIINLILSFLIGNIYYENRPFVNNSVNLLVKHRANSSFPSDHALGTISVAFGLGKYNKALGKMLTVISVIIGFSRVYVGNHYPFDVIGGYVIAFITNKIYNLVLRRKLEKIYLKLDRIAFSKLKFAKN